jgi:hypothetical protein
MLQQSIIHKPTQNISYGPEPKKIPWRLHPKYFIQPDNTAQFEPGCVDFAATWFQSRQDVSFNSVLGEDDI